MFAFTSTATSTVESSHSNHATHTDLPWMIEADHIEIDVKQEQVLFSGNVHFSDNIRQVWSNQAIYQQLQKKIILQGNVTVVDRYQVLECSLLQFENLTMQGLVIEGTIFFKNKALQIPFSKLKPSYLFSEQDNRFIVKGKKITSLSNQELFIHDGEFTLCDCKDLKPSWYISARKAKIIRDQQIELFWPVMYAHLFFFDMPFFAFPYISFPLQEKKTGFLAPRISGSGNTGFYFELPFYLPLTDSFDITPYYALLTERGSKVGSEFRWYQNDTLLQKTNLEFLWDRKFLINGEPLERFLIHSIGNSHQKISQSQWFHSHLDLQIASDAAYTKEFGKSLAKKELQYHTSSLYGHYQFKQVNLILAETYYQDLMFDGSGNLCLSCSISDKLKFSRFFHSQYPLQIQHTPSLSLFVTPMQFGSFSFYSQTQYLTAISNKATKVYHHEISHLSYLKAIFPRLAVGNIDSSFGVNLLGFRDEKSELLHLNQSRDLSVFPFYNAHYHIEWFKNYYNDMVTVQHRIGPHIEYNHIFLLNSQHDISPLAYLADIYSGGFNTLRVKNELTIQSDNKKYRFSIDPLFQYLMLDNNVSLSRFGFDFDSQFESFRFEPQVWFTNSKLHSIENSIDKHFSWQNLSLGLKQHYISGNTSKYGFHRFDQYSSIFGYDQTQSLHITQARVSLSLYQLLQASYSLSLNVNPLIPLYQFSEIRYTSSCRCWNASLVAQKHYQDDWPELYFTFDLTGLTRL